MPQPPPPSDAPPPPPVVRERPGNQAALLGWPRRVRWWLAWIGAGALAATIFPPLSLGWLAWVVLVPVLLLAVSRPRATPWRDGYLFGLVHFTCGFAWLREVFILAPVGVALICAAFPTCWLVLVRAVYRNLLIPESRDLAPRAGRSSMPDEIMRPASQAVFVLAAPILWCAMEWLRGWLFTGLPWNLLGVSQWANSYLLPMVRYTGVHGISFLIVLVNAAVFLAIQAWRQGSRERRLFRVPLAAIAAAAILPLAAHGRYRLPEPAGHLRIAAVQGNIPQIRDFTPEQLDLSIDVYWRLTREIVAAERPDLVVWPETAIPDSLINSAESWKRFQALLEEVKTPMLVGTIMYRTGPRGPGQLDVYNSAVLFNAQGQLVDWYDKIHIVPFGEFVPFSRQWPVLDRVFGMGRSLTRGREHTIFPFGGDVRIGMNICYEDVFPEITAGAVRRGANLLITVTNDAWYRETSGSRQHLLNSLFRAVETMRPIFRSGNNSDSCLIMPDGRIVEPLTDPATGSPFYRGARVWNVPVYPDPPLTFYSRHGNLFAAACFGLALGIASWCVYRYLHRKQRLYEMIQGTR